MTKYEPVLYIAFMMVMLAFFLKSEPFSRTPPRASEPMEGTLYSSSDTVTASSAPTPVISTDVPVYVQDPSVLGLSKEVATFTVHLTPKNQAKYQICSLSALQEHIQKPSKTLSVQKKMSLVRQGIQEDNSKTVGSYTYALLDSALASSDLTFALNDQFRRGDMSWKLDTLARWKDLYLLKFSLSNDGRQEFFMGSVSSDTDGQLLPTGLYAPFSCRPGEEIQGIMTFPIAATRKKKISVHLYQGGSEVPFMTIKRISYDF